MPKEEREILKTFYDHKYPGCTHILELDDCFDYYASFCADHIKWSLFGNKNNNPEKLILLSEKAAYEIERYIYINKYNERGKELEEYYELLKKTIEILKKYHPSCECEDNNFTKRKIIGLKFEIPDTYGKYLNDILENIDLEKYSCYLPYEEVINTNAEWTFNDTYYTGKELNKILNKEDYFLIFLNMHLCLKGKEYSPIKNYEDFMASSCEILIVVIDSLIVYVYCKDKENLDIIRMNAEKNNYKKIILLTEDYENNSFYI